MAIRDHFKEPLYHSAVRYTRITLIKKTGNAEISFHVPHSVSRMMRWADSTPSERLKLKKPKPFRFKLVPLK